MLSAKSQPFCLSLSVLTRLYQEPGRFPQEFTAIKVRQCTMDDHDIWLRQWSVMSV